MEEDEKPKKKSFYQKLKYKFRLIILNETTFEEKFSFSLTGLNVLGAISTIAILLATIVSLIIVFTPLREYIPGYTDVNLRKNALKLALKADSLENIIRINEQYLLNKKSILEGNPISLGQETEIDSARNYKELKPQEYLQDSLLRVYVEKEDKYNLTGTRSKAPSDIRNVFFFPPLQGIITDTFNVSAEHYGIDIVAPKNEAIKAALDGTVIFCGWTAETGHVIHLQHHGNLVSIYKHNSVLLKKPGDLIKAGEVLGFVGNTGELSSGPHLHFELWFNGIPLDPQEYIIF